MFIRNHGTASTLVVLFVVVQNVCGQSAPHVNGVPPANPQTTVPMQIALPEAAQLLPGGSQVPPATPPTSGVTFGGKVLYIVSIDHSSIVIRDAEIKAIGEQRFIVGTAIGIGKLGELSQGRRFWRSLSSVLEIQEFSSVEEVKTYFSQFTR